GDRSRSKQLSEERDIGEAGNLVQRFRFAIIEKTADREALTIFHLDVRRYAARRKCGDGEALKHQAVCKIERTHFGLDRKLQRAARRHYGRESEPNPEFAELNGHGAEPCAAALQGRIGKLAAREKAGVMSIDRQDIRLGEDLQEIAALQRGDRGAES